MLIINTLNIALGLFFLSVGLWCLIYFFEPLKNWLKADAWLNDSGMDGDNFFGVVVVTLSLLSLISGGVFILEFFNLNSL